MSYKLNNHLGFHFISDVAGEVPVIRKNYFGWIWINTFDKILYTTKKVGRVTTLVATPFGPKQIPNITLLSTGWNLVSGNYEYDIVNSNIKATSIVNVIPEIESSSIVGIAEIYTKMVSTDGSVKLFAKNTPTDDIVVTINIF
jgi:hypothetical protein